MTIPSKIGVLKEILFQEMQQNLGASHFVHKIRPNKNHPEELKALISQLSIQNAKHDTRSEAGRRRIQGRQTYFLFLGTAQKPNVILSLIQTPNGTWFYNEASNLNQLLETETQEKTNGT